MARTAAVIGRGLHKPSDGRGGEILRSADMRDAVGPIDRAAPIWPARVDARVTAGVMFGRLARQMGGTGLSGSAGATAIRFQTGRENNPCPTTRKATASGPW